MKLTGHRQERNLFKYIKINNDNAAEMLKDFWEKQANKIIEREVEVIKPQ